MLEDARDLINHGQFVVARGNEAVNPFIVHNHVTRRASYGAAACTLDAHFILAQNFHNAPAFDGLKCVG